METILILIQNNINMIKNMTNKTNQKQILDIKQLLQKSMTINEKQEEETNLRRKKGYKNNL